MTRDTQRTKLYAAERSAFQHSMGTAYWNVLLSPDEARDYLQRLMRSRWFRKQYPQVKQLAFSVLAQHATHAYGGFDQIKGEANILMGPRICTRWVLLHELAHACAQATYGDHQGKQIAAHGREFCHTYIKLVQHDQALAARRLRAEFKAYGVRYCLPRAKRPPLSPEAQQQRLGNLRRAQETIRARTKHTSTIVTITTATVS